MLVYKLHSVLFSIRCCTGNTQPIAKHSFLKPSVNLLTLFLLSSKTCSYFHVPISIPVNIIGKPDGAQLETYVILGVILYR
jgi:hypothetical protein